MLRRNAVVTCLNIGAGYASAPTTPRGSSANSNAGSDKVIFIWLFDVNKVDATNENENY